MADGKAITAKAARLIEALRPAPLRRSLVGFESIKRGA
jgi:hypothetical protein